MQQIIITVNGQNMTFLGPESWEEVTPRMYRQWLRSLDQEGGEFALMQIWFGLRYIHMRWLDEEQRLALVNAIAFTNARPRKWMLPHLQNPLAGRLYGPGSALEHLTFGEFMAAETARQQEDTAMLGAVLYAPAGKRRFDPAAIERRLGRFTRQHKADLNSILINYLGCMDALAERFRFVFRPGNGEGAAGSWLDIGLSLARQTNALGTYTDLESTNIYLVLPVLDAILKEQAELEKKMRHESR